MRIRLVAFAQVRESLGFGQRDIEVAPGATVAVLWSQVARESEALAGLRESTRFARNGTLVEPEATLIDGDEVAFMPPVGGG
jgi:molybdopterin converting factor small subunit